MDLKDKSIKELKNIIEECNNTISEKIKEEIYKSVENYLFKYFKEIDSENMNFVFGIGEDKDAVNMFSIQYFQESIGFSSCYNVNAEYLKRDCKEITKEEFEAKIKEAEKEIYKLYESVLKR